MREVSKKYSDRLPDLKKNVEESQEYFADNVQRYNDFMRFVFKSSMNDDELGALQETGKPSIEFNILEAYISRLRGEFAKQHPDVQARAADGVPLSQLNAEFTETLNVVEGHLKAIFSDNSNDMLAYNVMTDELAGGFSVMKVGTEYVNEMSFEQKVFVSRVFDPTLCFFDPMARDSHKGDGRYCGELYPLDRVTFEEQYGKEATEKMTFAREFAGFNWSYQSEQKDIVLVCDYYEKKIKKEKILKLSNGHVLTEKRYKAFLEQWNEAGHLEPPPEPLKEGGERWSNIETICRYRFCEGMMLDYVETDFKYLPLVFVDGNSVIITEGGTSGQMTRPYVYHAMGIQRLKNFAGQSLANELENTIQHKFMVPIEVIPQQYQDAYQNVQKAQTLVYNSIIEVNGQMVPSTPPREIQRTPIPPEISGTFRMSDEMTQAILGSYDGAAGVNRSEISGIAFARSAIQSNNASMPYIVGYIKSLNRVAKIVLDLIPKYYRTPRSLPILKPDGKRDHVEINKKGSIYMNYDPNTIEIKVDVGVNFAMQKEIALQTIISLTQASPQFAKFMGQNGMQILLDNIEIRGIDGLKEKAAEFEKQEIQAQQQQQQAEMQQMQAQAQQMQKQSQIDEQRLMMEMQQAQKVLQSPTIEQLGMMSIQEKTKVDAANLAIKERDSETKFLETMAKVQMSGAELDMKAAQQDAETTRETIKAVVELSKNMEMNDDSSEH
jgi:hypothetical protein